MSIENRQVGAVPRQVRLAGALVGCQGLLGIAVAAVFAGQALFTGAGPNGSVWAGAGYFLLMGGALLAVGAGLVRGRRWARTPAIVTQLLLLPVVYSLLGPSRQLLLGIVAGVVVLVAFLLLISEPSRLWSLALDDVDPEARPRP